MSTTIAWIRRELRLHDHAVLATALADKAPVQPVFVFDTEVLARFTHKKDRRLNFIAQALLHMDAQLHAQGGGMLVLVGKASAVLPTLAEALESALIVSAEDFEPATRARDAAVKKAFGGRFVQVLDHLLQSPQRIVKDDGTPYKVFTPFYKRWLQAFGPMDLAPYEVKGKGRWADVTQMRRKATAAGLAVVPMTSAKAMLDAVGYEAIDDTEWTVDDAAARLKDFVAARMKAYPTARDVMGKAGTSRLSPYLRHGLVSVRACMAAAREGGAGGDKWVSELAWRDFYATILFHFPQVVEHEFSEQYRQLPWSRSTKMLEAFCAARTGYPIVDAAVRELLQTGWMHNRARMIVASFFTKDLLLDWRLGEEFFAQHLMDYDLASNNGGWQWAASTGTDAAPYFRVFNPTLQGKKFDARGDYVRYYLPELETVPDKYIHEPWNSGMTLDYPAPIVDHNEQRHKAIAMFKDLKG